MRVLFVCTGNTCRSPMAEHLFRKMASDAGRSDVIVSSAGVAPSPWIGFPEEAREALADYGVTGVSHRAQGLSNDLVESADLVLTLEDRHQRRVVDLFPKAKNKVHVLNVFAGLGTESDGIKDPIGQPAHVYKSVLLDIKRALEKVLEKI